MCAATGARLSKFGQSRASAAAHHHGFDTALTVWTLRSSEAGLLPRVHGCSMFTRGETQAIAVVTLGGEADAQRIDGLGDTEKFRRFYLNYFFPHSCVGEVLPGAHAPCEA